MLVPLPGDIECRKLGKLTVQFTSYDPSSPVFTAPLIAFKVAPLCEGHLRIVAMQISNVTILATLKPPRPQV